MKLLKRRRRRKSSKPVSYDLRKDRRFRPPKRRPWMKILLLPFLVLLGFGVYGVFFSGYFSIHHIGIALSANYVSETRISTALSHYRGKNIFQVHAFSMEEALKDLVPEVADVRIEKTYPNEILVHVELVEPVLVLRQEYHEPWYLLGKNGHVLSSFTPSTDIYAGLMHLFTPTKTKVLDVLPLKDLEEFDVAYQAEDVTERTEGIALGTSIDSFTVSVERQETKEVPIELAIGQAVMGEESVSEVLELLDHFEQQVGLVVRELWYFPVERELHLVVRDGWKVKFSFVRGLMRQLEDMIDTLSLINFASEEFYYVDLRVPGKVFVCRKRSCNR